MKKLVLYIIFFAVMSAVALLPLFHSGFFTMHDDQQIARLYELTQILHQGQLPPRWVPDLGFGYGYALFDFYPPLVYYLGFLVHSLGFGYIDSTKIVMGLGFVLSALFMFLWIRKRFGTVPGLVAATLYTYAPYHAVDLYVRGAFAEFFSFVWIPAVFWSFDMLSEKKTWKWTLITGILLSFVLLTHDLIAMQASVFIAGYMCWTLFEKRTEWKKVILWYIVAGGIALGLTAYFWLPSLVDKQYTLVDAILTKDLASYQLHFVCLKQLWTGPWGYGASIPECSDQLSFEIGKMHLIASGVALLLLLVAWLKGKKEKTGFILFLFLNLFVATWLTTSKSLFLWNMIKPFAYIQFPWRFLLFSALFSSSLTGVVVWQIGRFSQKGAWVAAILIGCISIGLMAGNMHPENYLSKSDKDYTSYQDIAWRISRSSYEYVPKEVRTVKSDINTTLVAITPDTIASSPAIILSGKATILTQKNTAADKSFLIHATSQATIRINTFAYPGWMVFVDGRQVTPDTNNPLHLLTVSVPTGEHSIVAVFRETSPRLVADMVSLITLIICILISGIFAKRHVQ